MLGSRWRRRIELLAAMAAALAFICAAGAAVPRDEFGGRQNTRRAATGFFRKTRAEGRWWLVDPHGYLFLSVGVNSVALQDAWDGSGQGNPYREAALGQHGGEREWAREAVERLKKWGFNTVGDGSDRVMRGQGLPYAVNLKCTAAWPREDDGKFPDVFDAGFERAVRRHVAQRCRELSDDPWLLGYFTDNELPWGSIERPGETLLAQFLAFADEASGRKALLSVLVQRHLNIEELNAVWGTAYDSFNDIGRVPQVGSRIPETDIEAFQREVAREYFRVVHDALRAVDRYHLILGPRFAGNVPRPVLEAMGEYVDAVSLVVREAAPPADELRRIHRVTGWPVIVAEFGAGAAVRAGQGSSAVGAQILEERAQRYEEFVPSALTLPMVVGVHWFSYVDQWEEDRWGGERVQIGLVSRHDEPHYTLVETVSRINAGIYEQVAPALPPGDGSGL
jgi:hypothetical protein